MDTTIDQNWSLFWTDLDKFSAQFVGAKGGKLDLIEKIFSWEWPKNWQGINWNFRGQNNWANKGGCGNANVRRENVPK
jgi:hypothetical protein